LITSLLSGATDCYCCSGNIELTEKKIIDIVLMGGILVARIGLSRSDSPIER